MFSVKLCITVRVTLSMLPRARKTVLQLSKMPREEKGGESETEGSGVFRSAF